MSAKTDKSIRRDLRRAIGDEALQTLDANIHAIRQLDAMVRSLDAKTLRQLTELEARMQRLAVFTPAMSAPKGWLEWFLGPG